MNRNDGGDTQRLDYRAADGFLRALCLASLAGPALAQGDRLTGPDGAEWEARASAQPIFPPERATIQLAVVGGPDLGVVVMR